MSLRPCCFYPRLREGGDEFGALIYGFLSCFYPRLREGGDIQRFHFISLRGVSIHASAREATSHCLVLCLRGKVSIHASAREATRPIFGTDRSAMVSIHASAREATVFCLRRLGILDVSIHASAREATDADRPGPRPFRVSIHASAREATGRSRAREGAGDVSIHASAREATRCLPRIRSGRSGFYPRLREGGDEHLAEAANRLPGFYPRLREGGDHGANTHFPPCQRFYPRLREGGDAATAVPEAIILPFLSTPPRGRRRGVGRCVQRTDVVSIHASAREATFRMRGRM